MAVHNQPASSDDMVVLDQHGPLTEWAKEPSVRDLEKDLQMSKPMHDTNVSRVRGWLDLRNVEGNAKPKAGTNRSKVQNKLIRKQNEWRYSALSEPFLSSQKLFDITPTTWEDKESSLQNDQVVNYQMRTKLDRVRFIDKYVRKCTDEGTVIVRPGWRRETRIVEREVPVFTYYQQTDPAGIQQLQEALVLKQENPQGYEDLPEEVKAAVDYSIEKGIPVFATITGTQTVKEEKLVKNHPTLDILNVDNVYLDPDCEDDISRAKFAIISFPTSKAELTADGRYKNLDRVNWSGSTPLSNPDHAMRQDQSGVQFEDDLRKTVIAYEYWGFYDIEGNDVLVPIVATWIGGTLIRMEKNPYPDEELPIVVVPYMPVDGSLMGEPDAVLLEENQAIMGALTRGMIDLMGRSANGQTGTAMGFLDVLNRRRFEKGQDYEYNPQMPPEVAVYQHKYPEIPASALNMLAMQNQEAESLTGVKAFAGGLSGEAYGDVAAGIRGMLDAASKREMSILRRLAEGMEKIGRKLVSMNQAFLSEEEVVQITNGDFVKVRREDIQGEFNLTVDISTAEIDEAKAQDLGFMLQTLGNTVPWEITKMILMEIARLKRMPALVQMIEKYEPQPDPLEEKKKELEIAKIDAQIQELHSKAMLNQAKAQGEVADTDNKNLDFIEQETGTKHARDMDKVQAQSEANQLLEITKGMLAGAEKKPSTKDIGAALNLHNLASQTV